MVYIINAQFFKYEKPEKGKKKKGRIYSHIIMYNDGVGIYWYNIRLRPPQ